MGDGVVERVSRGDTMITLLEIHPANHMPDHDNMVAVVVWDFENLRPFLAQDRRLGRKSWWFWKYVLMWQELPEVTK